MDAIGGPCTLFDKMTEHFGHDLESRRRVWSIDDFTERIKGRVPLKGLLVEIWNSVGCRSASLVDLGERARLLFRGTQCEDGCLREMKRSTELCKGCMTVPWGIGGLYWTGKFVDERGSLTKSMEKD